MPELPEVELVKRGISCLKNKVIHKITVYNPNLRVEVPQNIEAILQNACVQSIRRIAKYLVFTTNIKHYMIIHLGMTGSILLSDKLNNAKHDHVVIHFTDGTIMIYNDPRRFGMITLQNEDEFKKFVTLFGPDPLSVKFNAYYLYGKVNKKTPVKHVLMNHKIVSGIGNIYANEILFNAHVSPFAKIISLHECERIVEASKKIIRKAIQYGGSTLKDYVHPNGNKGSYGNMLTIYGKERKKCPECQNQIRKIRQGGRSTFFCPQCQELNNYSS